jgi:predicted acetyltransferase
MEMQIRPITASEVCGLREIMGLTLAFDPQDDATAIFHQMVDLSRTLGAFVESQLVGGLVSFGQRLSVPGGSVPVAAGTFAGVIPTHRRRGILRRLMEIYHGDARGRGEAAALLWSTESSIYGRFGYAPAAFLHHAVIERTYGRIPAPPPGGAVRLITAEAAARVLPAVYDRLWGHRAGLLTRDPLWWRYRVLHDAPWRREGATAYRHAVYEEGGEPLGYVLYRQTNAWDEHGLPAGRLLVQELMAAAPTARLALWSFVFGVDLSRTVEIWNLPVEDPLSWQLEEPRRLKVFPRDSLWLRILDVPAALSARCYGVEGRLAIRVEDPVFSANCGTFALDGGPAGAACKSATEPAELELGIAALGAVYLGGNRPSALAHAGLIRGTPNALRLADAMFATASPPWCPEKI